MESLGITYGLFNSVVFGCFNAIHGLIYYRYLTCEWRDFEMDPVRYKIRECRDQEKIESFLHQARIGHLGLVDGKLPYVVPLNYVWTEGKLYFHGAGAEGGIIL